MKCTRSIRSGQAAEAEDGTEVPENVMRSIKLKLHKAEKFDEIWRSAGIATKSKARTMCTLYMHCVTVHTLYAHYTHTVSLYTLCHCAYTVQHLWKPAL